MKKILIVAILSLLLLTACGGSKTTGKRVAIPSTSGNSITGNAVADIAVGDELAPEKTAAEVLKELQSAEGTTTAASGPKSGTFYPPITVTGTEREALKQKTRALFQTSVYAPTVDADSTSGSRYYDKNGEPENLPEGYGGDDRNGE